MNLDDLMALLDRPIAYHRIFRTIAGSVTAAVMLSQAIYWQRRTTSADGWFYKTCEEWEEETGLSRYEQETARKALRQIGVIIEERRGIPAKLYYRVDTQRLQTLLEQHSKSVNQAHNVVSTTMGDSHKQGSGFTTSKEVVSPQTIKLTETTTETTYREEEDNQVKMIVKARNDFSSSDEHDASGERTHPSKTKSSKTKTVKSLSESEQTAPSQQTGSRPLEISPAARRDISRFEPSPPPPLDNHTTPPAGSDSRPQGEAQAGLLVEPSQPPSSPPNSKREFRRNLELEERIYQALGTELTVELRAIQRICKRHGEAWYGWLRTHLMPQLERIGAEHAPQAVRAAVRAFHGGTNPARYGLADFVKALEQYQPPKRTKTHAERVNEVAQSILEEIERERALDAERR